MRFAQGPEGIVQEPCTVDVHPGGGRHTQIASISFAVEQIATETIAKQRAVHMQLRVVGHLHQRRTIVSRESSPGSFRDCVSPRDRASPTKDNFITRPFVG